MTTTTTTLRRTMGGILASVLLALVLTSDVANAYTHTDLANTVKRLDSVESVEELRLIIEHLKTVTADLGESEKYRDFISVLELAATVAEQKGTTTEEDFVRRGAWDDFKASLKKAGKKIKGTFGKRAEESEEEGLDSIKRGMWDDFKASMSRAGKKIKSKFGKRQAQQELQAAFEALDAVQSPAEMLEAVENLKEVTESLGVRDQYEHIINLFEAVAMIASQHEQQGPETSEEDEEKRGAWDDFKASVKKAGRKVKGAFGKRESSDRALIDALVGLDEAKTTEQRRAALEKLKTVTRDLGVADDYKDVIVGLESVVALQEQMEQMQMQQMKEMQQMQMQQIEQMQKMQYQHAPMAGSPMEEAKKRGAWEDFKASVKKAGKKVKNAFGKRDAEMEAETEKRAEMGVEKETEVEKKNAWENFKDNLRGFL